MDGTIRTLFSAKLEEGVERKELPCPMRERERELPSPTMTDGEEGGERKVRIPLWECMWAVAPVSMTQSAPPWFIDT
jgi:hypothetical protein